MAEPEGIKRLAPKRKCKFNDDWKRDIKIYICLDSEVAGHSSTTLHTVGLLLLSEEAS